MHETGRLLRKWAGAIERQALVMGFCSDTDMMGATLLRLSCADGAEGACRKPTSAQMAKRLLGICQAEGLQVNEATLSCLVEGTNGDIRAILGQLQMIRLRRSVLAYDDAKVACSLNALQ